LSTTSGNTIQTEQEPKIYQNVCELTFFESLSVVLIIATILASHSAAFPDTGTYSFDNSKSKTVLGIEYITSEQTIRDTLEQFIALEKELGVE
jgi:hypothetical protein